MSNYMGLMPTMMTSAPVVAAEEHHAEASGGLPQFDPTSWPSQIFWLALTFTVLYVIFSRIILPRMGGVIGARQAKIEGDMKEAEALSAQAELVKEQFEQGLKKAALEASETVRSADEASKAKLSSAIADFRSRYEAEISKTESRLEASSKVALESMNTIAAEIAAQAAEKIAGIPADHSQAESVVRSLSQKAKAA